MRFGTDHSDFILQQLRSRGAKAKKRGREILTTCMNPGHQDRHPSMSIRADGGPFLCRSCGYKGSWKTLVRDLGMDPLPGSDQEKDNVRRGLTEADGQRRSAVADVEENLAKSLNRPQRPSGLRPWTRGGFRGFSPQVLRRLNTQLWNDYGVMRAFWEFLDLRGEFAGGTGRVLPESEPPRQDDESPADYKVRLNDWYRSGNPKYRNIPRCKVKQILYPLHIYPRMPRVVVLVEGPTSAIRILDAGMDALAILGVENWSPAKAAALTKASGVILLFDGDDAGRRATETVKSDLLASGVEVVVLDLPNKVDPCDMSERWLNLVRFEYNQLLEKYKDSSDPAALPIPT